MIARAVFSREGDRQPLRAMHLDNESSQEMSELPKSRSNVPSWKSQGSPKGRESQGDRVPIVVRERESRSHGEGEQVTRFSRK